MGFGEEDTGRTIYVGSPKSDTRLRIYDKAAEQDISKDKRIGFVDWTRYELQIRNDLAHETYVRINQMLSENLGSSEMPVLASLFASILRPMFFVCESAETVVESRKHKKILVPSENWCLMFSKFDFNRPRPVRLAPTLSNLTRYVLGAASAYKALQIVFPSFDDLFREKVDEAAFNEKHEELLLDFAPYHSEGIESDIAFYNYPF
jgi:hypothetical protein